MLTPLVVVLLVLASCGPAPLGRTTLRATRGETERRVATSPPSDIDLGRSTIAGRALTREEERVFFSLQSNAARIRGLPFVRPVLIRVQSRDDIVAFVRSRIDREELERARIFYAALGMIDPQLDVERMILALMGEQIVGYYDPEESVLVVREDVVDDLQREEDLAGAQSALVLVHEFVHALQDQHLGLGEAYRLERTIDGDNAFASLVEGDATLAMIGWALEKEGLRLEALTGNPALLRQLLDSALPVGGPELEAAPPIVRAPLLSRYLHGVAYCAYLHGRGGFQWIDGAFRHPPESTERILHPERYERGDRLEAVSLPPLPELEASGYLVHDEDTLGELEMSVYFAQGTGQDRNPRAAEGWGGDRIRVYRRGEATAVVWFTTWDDEREAMEAEAAAIQVRNAIPEPRRAEHQVRRSGRAVLIVRDLPVPLQASVSASFEAFASSLPSRPRILDAPRTGG